MAPIERDVALYNQQVLRHQHSSSSDHGHPLIPMWDSSDPERAPPPLPLPPHSPRVGVSRPGTSTAIQTAHAAMSEKARESSLMSNVLSKRMGETSPERTPRASFSSNSLASDAGSSIRSHSHRRMQSLQPSSVRDLSFMIESAGGHGGHNGHNGRSSSPEKRPSTPHAARNDPFVDEPANPGPGPSLTPIVRPIVRRPHQSILGENTPPQSATMMALHNMASASPSPSHQKDTAMPVPPVPRPLPQAPTQNFQNFSPTVQSEYGPSPPPLSNITNTGSHAVSHAVSTTKMTRANTLANSMSGHVDTSGKPPNFSMDNLSKQILSLTTIATSLQKDMAALSRRSRDNATDLMSLKEATNARDEDIRKSLREIINSASDVGSMRSRDSYPGGSFLIDNKPHHGHHPSATSPLQKTIRPFSLPRIPSPNSFAASLDRESMSTPSLCGGEGAQTIGMLERIMREMGTKEGQDQLLKRLADMADKLSGMATAAKLEDLVEYLRSREARTLISTQSPTSPFDSDDTITAAPTRPRNYSFGDSAPSHLEIEYTSKGRMAQRAERLLAAAGTNDQRRSSAPTVGTSEIINDDVLRIIKTVKDSVAQGGGLTAEVKALVRELRGEVLGMGREIGRRLDEVEVRAQEEDQPAAATQAEMAKVVEDGLGEMKQHMSDLMREHRRQSASSAATIAAAAAQAVPAIDYDEVYNSMRAALKDARASKPSKHELCREDVIEAVKEAWETYKPEIEIQQIGLERDEVLACLQQGLQDYAPRDDARQSKEGKEGKGATRDEVFQAVVEGMKHFVPPQMAPSGLSRDEVLGAVRECLEEFEFPVAPSAMSAEITKEDMVDAVKKGLDGFDLSRASSDREIVSMRAARGASAHSAHDQDDEVVTRLNDLLRCMRDEFKAVSDEAKENVAANGRDTEQVLDATRDGLEKLRLDLETYVDKVAAAVTHQDFSEGLIRTLDVFRDEISELMAKSTQDSKEILQEEIESLRDTVNSSLVPAIPNGTSATGNKEVLEALQEGVSLLRGEISTRHVNSTSEVLDAIQEGLQDLRVSIDKLSNRPTDLSANDEILDALKSGLGEVRTDIDGLRDQNANALTTFEAGKAVVASDSARHDDIQHLESIIAQLQAKADAIDAAQSKLASEREAVREAPEETPEDPIWTQKLAAMESKLQAIHDAVSGLDQLDQLDQLDKLDKLDALDALDDKLDKLDALDKLDKHDALEGQLRDIHDVVRILHDREVDVKLPDLESKLNAIQESVSGLAGSREIVAAANVAAAEAAPRPAGDAASREDVEAIETILRNTKARLDDLIDGDQLVRKNHIDSIEALVLETKDSLTDLKDLMAGLSSREDIASVEALVAQVASGLDEIKGRQDTSGDGDDVDDADDKVTKTDVDAIALACLQVKTAVEKMSQADESTCLPSKDDLLALASVVGDVREQLELVSASQTKAAEDHQTEIVGVGERISDVKAFLEVLHETVKTRLEDGVLGMESVGKILDSLSDTIGRNSSDLSDLYETMKSEFEESRAGVVGAKLESDERFTETTATLSAKIDDSIGALMNKFDEFYAAADDKARIGEERDVEVQAAVVNTKTVADELKLLVDTLGTAVTDSLEKMETSFTTVFTRVEDLVAKSEEVRAEAKDEHQQTRDQVQEALAAVQELQGHVTENTPQILDTIKDVLLVVNDHFEHAKTSVVDMQDTIIKAIPEPHIPEPVEKYDDTAVHAKLDALAGHHERAVEAFAQLDKMDALVDHTLAVDEALGKIDRLVEHADGADKALEKLEQLEKLDQLEQLAKLDHLVSQADLTVETLVVLEKLDKLDELDKLDKLDKLDEILEQNQASSKALDEQQASLAKLVEFTDISTEAYIKLDSLEKLDQLEKLENLDKLDYLMDQADSTKEALTSLEGLSKLEKLGQLEKLEQLEKLDQLSKLEKLDEMDKLEQLEQLEQLEKLDQLEGLSKLDQLEGLSKLDQLAKLDQLEQLQKIDEVVEKSDEACRALVSLEQLQQLQKLEKLEQLEKLDQLEKLHQLDQLHQLEELVGHSRTADSKSDETLQRLATLEKVHEQVMRTAADLAQYMSAQTARIADEHEDREQTLRETSSALEVRQAQLSEADASLEALREEERRLKASVAGLRSEQESLQRHKTRLTADVSSLETALHLRREELHEMESRAEGLERRILEGVMDHSRVLLMAKANKGREAMSRKRVVPSKRETKETKESKESKETKETKPRAAFNLAMSTKRQPMPANSPAGVAANGTGGSGRRILSLSQINSSSSGGSMRRSNSVRGHVGGLASVRKSSWGGRPPTKGYDYDGPETDKENAPLAEDEHEVEEVDEHDEVDGVDGQAVVRYGRASEGEADEFQECEDANEGHETGPTATDDAASEFYSGDEAEPVDGRGELVVYGAEA